MKPSHVLIIVFLLTSIQSTSGIGSSEDTSSLLSINPAQYENGYRYNVQGWIYLHIEGNAYDRGYQHGYLLAAEIIDMINRWSYTIHNHPQLAKISPRLSEEKFTTIAQRWWDFCTKQCTRLYWDKFPYEYQQELQGIAAGINDRNGQIHNRAVNAYDILTLNEMYEFMSKLTTRPKKVQPLQAFFHQLQQITPPLATTSYNDFLMEFYAAEPAHHCNGFIATGNATSHGQLVVTHSTICGGSMWWWNYFISLRWNILLDLAPSEGHRILMPTSPGLIWSDEDYYQNDAGIVLLETTLPQGLFDNKGLPLCIRARTALQYSNNIDEVVYTLRYRNDGCMNAVWLIGDTTTGEIARFELGYKAHLLLRQQNGFYWSANNPYDIGVRLEKFTLQKYLEKLVGRFLGIAGFGYHSLLYHPEPRDIKYEELGTKYYGHIDADIVKEITMTSPISDWITDIKITDSTLLAQNGVWLFFGNPWKHLNMTRYDTQDHVMQQVQPCGWVRIFGVPTNNSYSVPLINQKTSNGTSVIWQFKESSVPTNVYSTSGYVKNGVVLQTTDTGMLYAFNPKDGSLNWSTTIANHSTGPIVIDDGIILGHEDGVSAYSLLDGALLWMFSCAPVSHTPITQKNITYVGDSNGILYALDSSDGTLLWSLPLQGQSEVYVGSGANDSLLITIDLQCHKIDSSNQSIVWTYTTNGPITSPPTSYNNSVYFAAWDTFLYSVNASSGKLNWKTKVGWGVDTTPVCSKGLVIVGCMDNNVYAFDQKTGESIWVVSCSAAVHAQPVVYGGFVFFGADDGYCYAVNSSTGSFVWRFAAGATIEVGDLDSFITTPVLSNPCVDDGMVFIGLNGSVFALDAQTLEQPVLPPVSDHDENNDEYGDDDPIDIIEEDDEVDNSTFDSDDSLFYYGMIGGVTSIIVFLVILIFMVRRK